MCGNDARGSMCGNDARGSIDGNDVKLDGLNDTSICGDTVNDTRGTNQYEDSLFQTWLRELVQLPQYYQQCKDLGVNNLELFGQWNESDIDKFVKSVKFDNKKDRNRFYRNVRYFIDCFSSSMSLVKECHNKGDNGGNGGSAHGYRENCDNGDYGYKYGYRNKGGNGHGYRKNWDNGDKFGNGANAHKFHTYGDNGGYKYGYRKNCDNGDYHKRNERNYKETQQGYNLSELNLKDFFKCQKNPGLVYTKDNEVWKICDKCKRYFRAYPERWIHERDRKCLNM